jgi:hypothetical protein
MVVANVMPERVLQGQEAREGAVSGVQAPSVAANLSPQPTPKLSRFWYMFPIPAAMTVWCESSLSASAKFES